MKKYHYAPKTLFVYIASIVFLCLLMFPLAIMNLSFTPILLQSNQFMLRILAFPMLILSGMFFILSLIFFLFLVTIWSANYVKLSPTEIEYHQFPSIAMRCRWGDAQSVAKNTALENLFVESLSFRTGEWLGWRLVFQMRTLFKMNPFVIPIENFSGWRNGELRADVKQYAPGLLLN